jgi:hypothetical protein
MAGYLSNRWVLVAGLLVGVVGVVLLLAPGGASLDRPVGAAALVIFVALYVAGFFDWRRQAERDATDKASRDQAAHDKDIVGYARVMENRIGRHETPWLTCAEMPLFQQHYPALSPKVDLWWEMDRAASTNPYWLPNPVSEIPIRGQAQLELHAVAQGIMSGSCDRCREIAAELDAVRQRFHWRSRRASA